MCKKFEDEIDIYLKSVARARTTLYEMLFKEAKSLLTKLNKEIADIIDTHRMHIIAKAFRAAVASSSCLFKNNQYAPPNSNDNNRNGPANKNRPKRLYSESVNRGLDSPGYYGARPKHQFQHDSNDQSPVFTLGPSHKTASSTSKIATTSDHLPKNGPTEVTQNNKQYHKTAGTTLPSVCISTSSLHHKINPTTPACADDPVMDVEPSSLESIAHTSHLPYTKPDTDQTYQRTSEHPPDKTRLKLGGFFSRQLNTPKSTTTGTEPRHMDETPPYLTPARGINTGSFGFETPLTAVGKGD